MKIITVIITGILLMASVTFGETAITIYNEDLGVVRETREFEFPRGVGEIRFVDVAARIIPTSVHFSSDRAELLEQNYEYDLVDAPKLMSKYIDREVELTTEDGLFTGILLSASQGVVLRQEDQTIRLIAQDRVLNVHFPDLPQGLITRPTLVWTVESRRGGTGTAEVSYLTHGMNWQAEYVAVTDADDQNLSLTGWVNITNHSGATYENARIKLMAGDVQILPEQTRGRGTMRDYALMAEAPTPQFEEQAFYEYHLYTLQRPSTLRQNQIKQISLFPSASTPVKKEYRFEAYSGAKKVKVVLEVENRERVGLGIPLPRGKVRVYKEGPDGGLEFVGEDRIDHTPKDETIRISTGNAFDITGERTRMEYERRRGDARMEAYVVKLRNHKQETVEVIVVERFRGDWELLDGTTSGWTKKSATTVEWKVRLRPDEEREIRYRVLYQ